MGAQHPVALVLPKKCILLLLLMYLVLLFSLTRVDQVCLFLQLHVQCDINGSLHAHK